MSAEIDNVAPFVLLGLTVSQSLPNSRHLGESSHKTVGCAGVMRGRGGSRKLAPEFSCNN